MKSIDAILLDLATDLDVAWKKLDGAEPGSLYDFDDYGAAWDKAYKKASKALRKREDSLYHPLPLKRLVVPPSQRSIANFTSTLVPVPIVVDVTNGLDEPVEVLVTRMGKT